MFLGDGLTGDYKINCMDIDITNTNIVFGGSAY